MGKAVTLDLSEFIGKRLDLIINQIEINQLVCNNMMERVAVLYKFKAEYKLKSTILNIIPTKFTANLEPRYNRVNSKLRHIYICLIVTNKYNYVLKFASKYIIQYITIGNLIYKRNAKIWEKQE